MVYKKQTQYFDSFGKEPSLALYMALNRLTYLGTTHHRLAYLAYCLALVEFYPIEKANRPFAAVYTFYHKMILILLQVPTLLIEIKPLPYQTIYLLGARGGTHIKMQACLGITFAYEDLFQIYIAIGGCTALLVNPFYFYLLD